MPPLPSDCRDPETVGDAVSRLTHTLKRHRMIVPGDSLLVAVSGGPDSVALIHLLQRIAPNWKLSLSVAHVDHRLRPNAAESADFVAALSARLGLPYHCTARDVAAFARNRGMSVETAGRAVRYAFFSDLCIRYGYRRVAVGHHRDDSAEQFLLNLARGTGPSGLTGIVPVRDAWVIRPLIDFSRNDVMAFLAQEGLAWTQDPTNTDRGMRRNRIRHDLLPVLATHINPRIVETLARTADIISAENAWMDQMAGDLLTAATLARDGRSLTLSASGISQCPLPLQRRIWRLAIRLIKGDLQRIAFSHIDDVMALACREKGGGGSLHLPARILVAGSGDRITLRRCRRPLRRRPPAAAPGYSVLIDASLPPAGSPPRRIDLSAIDAVIAIGEDFREDSGHRHSAGHCVAFFDMEKLAFPLLVRSASLGDRFQPLGMKGSQKIFKLLKDSKIASERRALAPVLISGGTIVWVPGVKMGQPAAVSADTRRVVRAEFILRRPQK